MVCRPEVTQLRSDTPRCASEASEIKFTVSMELEFSLRFCKNVVPNQVKILFDPSVWAQFCCHGVAVLN